MDVVNIAKKSGCRISLGADAHDPLQLRFLDFALASVLKVGIRREHILNFMSPNELRNWLGAVRSCC